MNTPVYVEFADAVYTDHATQCAGGAAMLTFFALIRRQLTRSLVGPRLTLADGK
jgi:hypothetical protein